MSLRRADVANVVAFKEYFSKHLSMTSILRVEWTLGKGRIPLFPDGCHLLLPRAVRLRLRQNDPVVAKAFSVTGGVPATIYIFIYYCGL